MCKCHDTPKFLCNQGRLCPMRQPAPAEASTEIGAEPAAEKRQPVLGFLITLAPWVLIGWALYAVLNR